MDPYPRGSQPDLKVNRALAHWLSCANLPYNLLDGGAFLNFCFEMNPRFRVPSRPYLQQNYLDTGFESCTKMLSIFLQYLDLAVWISSDAWKSRYGKFSLISLTVHFIDEEWNYRAVPVGARNFKGGTLMRKFGIIWSQCLSNVESCKLQKRNTTSTRMSMLMSVR